MRRPLLSLAIVLVACADAAPGDASLSPEAAMVLTVGDSAAVELFAIDQVGTAEDPSTPYLVQLHRAGLFRHSEVLAISMDQSRVVPVARDLEAFEAVFARLPPELALPDTHRFLYGRVLTDFELDGRPELAYQVVVTPAKPFVSGEQVARVTAVGTGVLGRLFQRTPSVEVQLTDEGRKSLATFTRDHVGQQIAIAVGGQLFSEPWIRDPIPGGSIQLHVGEAPGAGQLAETLAAKLSPR